MNGEMQELMHSNPEWYKELQYQDVKVYIKDNINSASRSFVAIGYYLKYVRDNELFTEDGYSSIWEFAQAEYGISRSTASRFMAINDRFSVDGNSPILQEEYRDFSSSKLQEMLTLSDEQLERVTITTTRAEIREMKQPKADECAHAHAEPDCFIRDEINASSEAELKCSGGVSEDCDNCDKYEKPEPSKNCIHRPEYPCALSEAQKVAQGDGVDCHEKCCWGCPKHGQCGYECNASAHRPEEPEAIEITEDEFIIGFYQNCMYDHEKSIVSKKDIEMLRLELIKNHGKSYHGGSHVTDKGGTFACYPDKIVFRKPGDYEVQLQLKWGSYVSKLFKLLDAQPVVKEEADVPVETVEADIIQTIPEEHHEPEQPDLPILRNNDQRKEFIEAYETWPIWIDLKETGERYYRYDFDNGDSIVVKVYYCKIFDYKATNLDYVDRFRDGWGKEEYYLIESSKYFKDCQTNMTALIEYLKDYQKKK